LLLLCEDPRQWGKALHGDKAGLWRYRVGGYRPICEIQDNKVTVLLLQATEKTFIAKRRDHRDRIEFR